ncbi:unnamed protein product [Knipowitschia caucasica]|uniref:Store-operated calcium entry-associated regulatory factor n=1 Tax=Knipowitschia caucasica TaxID=637954 RepID=A0AAV2LKG7_KNICA
MVRGLIVFVVCLLLEPVCCWNDPGAVLLRDIQVLTLYKGRFTTGRRSSPVPQLQCVGGSAGCHAFSPDVVQCQNKGWDGVDVQWECKTDMDNSLRFGRVEVSCEGFNHPSDPYILAGSCGLEFSLELTEEGRKKNQGGWGSQRGSGGFGDFASSFFGDSSGHKTPPRQSPSPAGGGDAGGLLGVLLLLGVAFAVYKLFLSGNTGSQGPEGAQGPQGHQPDSGPPPPGFKPDYTSSGYPGANPGANPGYGFNSDYTQGQYFNTRGRSAHNTGTGGGGFWTGMGTGGLLGYMFGRQRSQPYQSHGYYSHADSYPRASSSSHSSTSSGTRTASGFGGTKRR